MAEVSEHAELGPELRRLAQTILDRLDPAVRAAAAMAGESMRGPGRCQQVWCPVCALAALISGEQHPMLTVIAEHSVALMSVIQAMVAGDAGDTGKAPPAPSDHRDGGDGVTPPSSSVRFHHIPIVVETDLETDLGGGVESDLDV